MKKNIKEPLLKKNYKSKSISNLRTHHLKYNYVEDEIVEIREEYFKNKDQKNLLMNKKVTHEDKLNITGKEEQKRSQEKERENKLTPNNARKILNKYLNRDKKS